MLGISFPGSELRLPAAGREQQRLRASTVHMWPFTLPASDRGSEGSVFTDMFYQ